MESQPAGPNEEHDASSPEKVNERPNNQSVVTYHRRSTDGSYVGVHLSPGFRFVPREEELIKDYLKMKIDNQTAEYIQICYVDVYKHTPEELAAAYDRNYGEDKWYFFSPRDRKYLKGSRPDRAAGNGYWKATGADTKLYDNDVCIGSKRSLVFIERKPSEDKKTNWMMREYLANQPRLQPQLPNHMRLDECVLRRIYKKPDHPSQKNVQGQQVQPLNLQAGQYTLTTAGDHNVDGQLGYPEPARQIPDLNFAPDDSSMPNSPSSNNNDHPQDGH